MKKSLLMLVAGTLIMCTSVMAWASEGGFLFVTFNGEKTPMTEQIYFGLSQDGFHWEALNGAEPVLVSTLGERGVRDPYILRAHDGKRFYLIATDLSINLNRNWGRAIKGGSKSIVIWESEDLVNWSKPRLVKVAPDDAGCTWAPEAIYDEEAGDYLVFWASTTKRDDFAKLRIWAARTVDFRTFGKPFIYMEGPGNIIDTTIILDNGKYIRFSKDETFKAIRMETSDRIMGPWQEVSEFSLAKMTGYEGPECFQVKQGQWCLLLDFYSRGQGYKPFVTENLTGGQFTAVPDFSLPFKFRHGFPLSVTGEEYDRLKAAYGTIRAAK